MNVLGDAQTTDARFWQGSSQMVPKRVGFFVCPGIQALDVVGPMDAFAAAEISNDASRSPCYEDYEEWPSKAWIDT
jgi:hypothetical protein